MARKIVVERIDDIDGTPIKNGEGETIAFSVDGVDYEIDLKDNNAKEFHSTLTFYIEHATRVGGRKRRSTPAVEPSQGRTRAKEIREWATTEGYELSTRGRIPAQIEEAYSAAH
ncbi:lysyl tRNA synthetase-like protein [Rhodococcus opacus M213]|uniref:Lysyl tRNA synthetase-like protein n=2 Tax=Rhodococcus opacus TaxID=37919 RepID=K8XAA4_RHOOP|nr:MULTISPECIES: Lsr2 family protein [Rhodococcus]ANS32069.1 lysyl tRNA synthetase-like protein [Rhodococcus opacus]EKT78443.1 lysyl tRNA synthetase-like protein [Rhodococcus opacus M213]GLK38310.1 protein lsr2 precursor [Rhodococcus wratislaviensis]